MAPLTIFLKPLTLQAPTPQHSQTHSTTTATANEGNRQQETAEELFKCV